jgi:hypothetical protein
VTAVAVAAVLVLGGAAGITVRLTTQSTPQVTDCRAQHSFVPAFFYSSATWQQAAETKPVPSYVILDISGKGAGTAPVGHFRRMVRKERAAGATVLGYSSTAYGRRPLSQVEMDIRHYEAWYGVTDIFLDEVHGVVSQLPYYRKLADYVRGAHPGAKIWINPGAYPNQGYMSVSNVVMAFEGPYSSYRHVAVPSWAFSYSPGRFANTIYATAQSQVGTALSLSRSRNAGYVYVTDGAGGNPYGTLPSYWPSEDAAITRGCPT